MKISVVLCAHSDRRWNDLLAAIRSVGCQSELPHEIIVAVDHNPELYLRAVEHFPDLKIISNSQPHGLNGTRNSAVSVATGDIVVFLDDDAEADADWLKNLSANYDSPNVAGVGGRIMPNWSQKRPIWFPEEFDWVVGCTYRGMPKSVKQVRNLIGCNMSFRRSIINRVGGFRTDIGHVGDLPRGNDETEFCIRLRQAIPSAVLLYQPGAVVMHKVPQTRANFRYYLWRCFLEGRSKAFLSVLVGARDGLQSERSYTLQTLPLGIWKGIADSVLGKNRLAFLRSFAIVAGFAVTTISYSIGRIGLFLKSFSSQNEMHQEAN